jgi:hypothetical protein
VTIVRILRVKNRRFSQIAILSVVFAAAAFLLGKVAIDLRLQRLDEAARPSSAQLEKWLDQANAAQIQADQPREYSLPDDLIESLAKPGEFSLYRKVADVPEIVRLAFAKAAGEAIFSMADPGGQWQATDIIRDPKLPVRRLSKVAVGGALCLLFYERGGVVKHNNVAVFRMADGQAEAIWHANVSHAVVSPSDLARALREKSYREMPFF